MAAKELTESTVSFKDTLNLPHTDFPIRPNAKIDDPLMIARWEKEDLFRTSFECNEGQEKFILHDGPPYANGNIHTGHAYNKILKDIAGKSQRMAGKHAPITPGWDCHGLPIEHKVSSEHPGLDPVALKKACRAYAQKWIDIQRQEFKNLGVLMDWDRPYITMSPSYEASILRAFGIFVANNYIERKNKTVPWCPSCQTVLATAEIEYEERKDPSIFVLFQLDPTIVEQQFPDLAGKDINFLVWTTTPWTLPLNRAVLLRPSTDYVVLDLKGTYAIVAKVLADKIAAMMAMEKIVVAEFNSDELISRGPKALHPFIAQLKVPVIADHSVMLEEGTACVHCAPGCGPQDYEVGVKNSLEIFSPVGIDGRYTFGINPEQLEGMPVADGQIWVIKKLVELDRLLHKGTIKHSYPHCWRCHNGLIFRATRQWFCDLSKGDLKQRVLDALETIVTIPEKSINRLKATIEGRLEWCLSRQRIWGVPIPALLCTKCDYTYVTQGLIERVAEQVAVEGIEYWDKAEVADLLPKGFICPMCTNPTFKKEMDILDVWFDSGISHYAVLLNNPELRFPADMYLEGTDQHRGWFQSSLLTALVLEKAAPMKLIFTHGFVVDEHGKKMSKSIGNVISPQDIMNQLGTDGLRLWAASLDCSGDAILSDTVLKNVGQVFGKIRNTCRFLLSNLYDFDIARDAVPLESMTVIDRDALLKLQEVREAIVQNYEDFDFTAIYHALSDYCSVDLSAYYLDIIKDRLYVEKADGPKRRSAQTACWTILDSLTHLIAPLLSITAEQISDLYQKDKQTSIHLQRFSPAVDVIPELSHEERKKFYALHHAQEDLLKEIRGSVLKAIEGLREKGIVKLALETKVTLHFDANIQERLAFFFDQLKNKNQNPTDFFKEYFIVSQVAWAQDANELQPTAVPGFSLRVERAPGTKCPRCWQWQESNNPHGLCDRCTEIVGNGK